MPCQIETCERPGPFVTGLCNAHYLKKRKYGDPLHVAKLPVPEGFKRCCQCGQVLAYGAFNGHSASKDGLYPSCRECTNRDKRARYAADPGPTNVRNLASRLRRRESVLATERQRWADRDVERSHAEFRARHLRRKFGITVEQYDALHVAQGGLCRVCGNPEADKDAKSGRTRYLAVDHCHETGRVRGLLCRRCNTALGLLGENAQTVKALLDYLE